MEDAQAVKSAFEKYAGMIAAVATYKDLEFAHENVQNVQVERGVVLAAAVQSLGPTPAPVEKLIELSNSASLAHVLVVDNSGHNRPVYRPLLIYAWLMAYRLWFERLSREQFGRWEEALRPWCDLLESRITQITWSAGAIPAASGAAIAEATWTALALHAAGKVFIRDAWTDLAADVFGRLTRSQDPSGTFLQQSASQNPEAFWYHELSILHAAASYAVQSEDRALAAAVQRATLHHLHDTQPDHATSQPWGLFAFIWNAQARPLADGLLHALSLRAQTDLDGVSLILLSDSLYCLRLFL